MTLASGNVSGTVAGGYLHHVGEPVGFSGYVDDFESGLAAVEFSLNDGATWTRYPLRGVRPDLGVSWSFSYTPERAGRYVLRARAVDARGVPAPLVASFAFEVLPARGVGAGESPVESYGSFGLRAVGSPELHGARLFRSGELSAVTPEQATFILNGLGVRSIYDIRNRWEVARRPEPCLVGARLVAVEPSTETRSRNARRRLAHGVIEEYGEPEERMRANYRRYVREYPLIGTVARSIAEEGVPALVHCKNGKDRTGVLCATLLRVAGFDDDAVMADYLASNVANASVIERDAARMGEGMTAHERAILMSFLEARPSYLREFFAEAERAYGSFDAYVERGLRLTLAQRDRLRELLGAGG